MGIEIECTVNGHEGEKVVYKSDGWKRKHRRLYFESGPMGDGAVWDVLRERMESWTLTDEDGKPLPQPHDAPGADEGEEPLPDISKLDEMGLDVWTWLVGSYTEAMIEVQALNRPSSSRSD